ncbi:MULTISPECIES: hypothetical protein [Pyrobaculum]|uniref:Uncharacterized protein n=2 Tax=Pyrobaculum TaxID=2276 RepID=A0A7L4P7A3_9CREN|nr:hypothetical protein [Pyrobaculum arsenaticum]MCY0889579.1 hypothetical protein [Pyrobaculum arsenaticum]NYR14417.1 hypothetical protein [Pyrobaculum arsenaticum]
MNLTVLVHYLFGLVGTSTVGYGLWTVLSASDVPPQSSHGVCGKSAYGDVM